MNGDYTCISFLLWGGLYILFKTIIILFANCSTSKFMTYTGYGRRVVYGMDRYRCGEDADHRGCVKYLMLYQATRAPLPHPTALPLYCRWRYRICITFVVMEVCVVWTYDCAIMGVGATHYATPTHTIYILLFHQHPYALNISVLLPPRFRWCLPSTLQQLDCPVDVQREDQTVKYPQPPHTQKRRDQGDGMMLKEAD